jgi:CheY-like chemotaxis protein
MVVEDDADLTLVEEFALRAAGYHVVTARDGRAALETLAHERPAVILLDMRMPGVNGWQFMRAFRAAYGREIRVIVVTAAEDAQQRAAEVDADDWLAKPFDVDELLDVVARHAGHAATHPA